MSISRLRDDGYSTAYFKSLLSLYQSMDSKKRAAKCPDAAAVIARILEAEGKEPRPERSRSEILSLVLSLELALAQLLPLTHVLLRRALLRHEYKELVGDHISDLYEKAIPRKPGTADPEPEQDVRDDVRFLLERVQRLRLGFSQFECLRNHVKWFVVLMLGVVIAVLVKLTHIDIKEQPMRVPLVAWAAAAGGMGALFSLLYRIGQAQPSAEVVAQMNIFSAVRKRVLWSPFLSVAEGVVAAGILYFIIVSGLLGGELFPSYGAGATTQPAATQCSDRPTMVGLFLLPPLSLAGIAKVLVWGFLAGFAERFVPDVLNQLQETSVSARSRSVQERPVDRPVIPAAGGEAAAGAGEGGAAAEPNELVMQGAPDVDPIPLGRGASLDVELTFKRPEPEVAKYVWKVEPVAGGTVLATVTPSPAGCKLHLAVADAAAVDDVVHVVVHAVPKAGQPLTWKGKVKVIKGP